MPPPIVTTRQACAYGASVVIALSIMVTGTLAAQLPSWVWVTVILFALFMITFAGFLFACDIEWYDFVSLRFLYYFIMVAAIFFIFIATFNIQSTYLYLPICIDTGIYLGFIVKQIWQQSSWRALRRSIIQYLSSREDSLPQREPTRGAHSIADAQSEHFPSVYSDGSSPRPSEDTPRIEDHYNDHTTGILRSENPWTTT